MPFWSFCGKQSPSEPPSFLTIRDDFRTCESFIINKKLIVSVQIIFIREISEYKGSLSDKFSEQFHYYSNITQCLAAVIGSRKFNVWLSVHPRQVTFLEDSVSLDSHSKRSDPVPVPLNYYELQAWGNTKRWEGRGSPIPERNMVTDVWCQYRTQHVTHQPGSGHQLQKGKYHSHKNYRLQIRLN